MERSDRPLWLSSQIDRNPKSVPAISTDHPLAARDIQSGASSLAKHGVPYFSAVYGSIEDLVAAPGP